MRSASYSSLIKPSTSPEASAHDGQAGAPYPPAATSCTPPRPEGSQHFGTRRPDRFERRAPRPNLCGRLPRSCDIATAKSVFRRAALFPWLPAPMAVGTLGVHGRNTRGFEICQSPRPAGRTFTHSSRACEDGLKPKRSRMRTPPSREPPTQVREARMTSANIGGADAAIRRKAASRGAGTTSGRPLPRRLPPAVLVSCPAGRALNVPPGGDSA